MKDKIKDECFILRGVNIPCNGLRKWQNETIDWTVHLDKFHHCPFCNFRLQPEPGPEDPWLYHNAIIDLIYRADRRTVVYTGQKIDTDYCVRGTPWEMVPNWINTIEITKHGNIICIDNSYASESKYFKWITCPESLKGKEYQRPEWTGLLPGVN